MSTTPDRQPVREASLLQWLRWRQIRNTLAVVTRHSPLRVLTILFSCVLIWGTIFALTYLGLQELRYRWHWVLNGMLIGEVFKLMFIALSALLFFSTGIILYSSLFLGKESAFLLTTPLSADQIFAFKFQGAVGFSSWAFVLLVSPVFLAYGLVGPDNGAGWFYYVLVPVFFFGLVLFPGSAGALTCLLFVNFFPRRRLQILALLLVLLVGLLGWWIATRVWPAATQLWRGSSALAGLFGEFSLLAELFPPARWTAEGFRAAANDDPAAALYYLALVWSNGLVLYLGVAWLAARIYRRGHDRLATGAGQRRVYGTSNLDRAFAALFFFVDEQTRLLVAKDFRTFRRDPAQWGQVLIFLGLVALIFGNIRNFFLQDIAGQFQNGISLLYLTATGFLMCAYAGRFIYPMLSLEGRKFWILGLLPLERDKLLWGKFYFSAICTLLIGELLCNLSNFVLGMPWEIIAVHALTVLVLSLGMSGLSTGLGATMPNFRETDPSKIAVGFGGTMMLIAGLVFQLAVVLLMAGPWHFLRMLAAGNNTHMDPANPWLWLGLALGLIVGGLGAWLPMRAGRRALQRMEF